MKSILSVLTTAALILSALTACASGGRVGRVEEARVTPSPTMTATSSPRPTATTAPNAADGGVIEDDRTEGALGRAADKAGDAVGDVVGGVGNAVGDVVGGVGNAIGDAANGMEDAVSGRDADRTNETRTRP